MDAVRSIGMCVTVCVYVWCDVYASENMVADCLAHRWIWWNENSELSMEICFFGWAIVCGAFGIRFVYSIAWLNVWCAR